MYGPWRRVHITLMRVAILLGTLGALVAGCASSTVPANQVAATTETDACTSLRTRTRGSVLPFGSDAKHPHIRPPVVILETAKAPDKDKDAKEAAAKKKGQCLTMR